MVVSLDFSVDVNTVMFAKYEKCHLLFIY